MKNKWQKARDEACGEKEERCRAGAGEEGEGGADKPDCLGDRVRFPALCGVSDCDRPWFQVQLVVAWL